MAYTETTTTGYGTRVGNSLKGILFGIVLIIASILLLWWNEGRTIDVTQGLAEGEKITVDGKISPIDKSLDGKLIYINGKADTKEILEDSTFFVSENSIKLIRDVEMYQWKENKKSSSKDNLGGSETTTTTYTYEKKWSNDKISSSSFKEAGHDNPSYWQFESLRTISKEVKVGDMKLTNAFVNQLNEESNVSIKEDNFNKFIESSKITNAQNLNDFIYIGSGSINNPQIGDLKISFSAVYPYEISAIGQQNGDRLISYNTKTDTLINLLESGTVSIGEIYKQANSDNMFVAWMLRALGLFLMFVGFKLLFGLIVTLAKVLPFLSTILGVGTGLISFILTLIVGGSTIIIAWFFVRPIVSIILMFVIIGIIFAIKKYSPIKK